MVRQSYILLLCRYLENVVIDDNPCITFGPRVFDDRSLTQEELNRVIDPRFDRELDIEMLLSVIGDL